MSWCRAKEIKTIDSLTLIATALNLLFQSPPQLSDVLATIEANHPKLVSAQANVAARQGQVQQKRGAFDPVLSVGSETLRYNTSTDPGKAAYSEIVDGNVEVATRSGIGFLVGTRLARGKIKSPNSATGLFESYIGVKIPLLRGAAGFNDKAFAERQAEIDVSVAEADYRVVRLDTRRMGAIAYWEWVGAGRNLSIARNLLRIAQERAEAIRQRYEAGDLPQVDVIEASGEVERRRGATVKAERELQKAAIKLSLYLWDSRGEPRLPLFGAERANFPTPADLPAEEQLSAEQRALENRPELRIIDRTAESLELTKTLARSDRRPRLDLTIGPGYDFGGIGNTAKVGVFYSVPLRQNTVDGRIAEADAKLEKLSADRLQLRGSITAQVSDGASAVRTPYRRILAAQAELDLARRLEQAERDRFELGDGTIFLLNQRERARAESETRLVEVLVEYNSARASLRAAEGSL